MALRKEIAAMVIKTEMDDMDFSIPSTDFSGIGHRLVARKRACGNDKVCLSIPYLLIPVI